MQMSKFEEMLKHPQILYQEIKKLEEQVQALQNQVRLEKTSVEGVQVEVQKKEDVNKSRNRQIDEIWDAVMGRSVSDSMLEKINEKLKESGAGEDKIYAFKSNTIIKAYNHYCIATKKNANKTVMLVRQVLDKYTDNILLNKSQRQSYIMPYAGRASRQPAEVFLNELKENSKTAEQMRANAIDLPEEDPDSVDNIDEGDVDKQAENLLGDFNADF